MLKNNKIFCEYDFKISFYDFRDVSALYDAMLNLKELHPDLPHRIGFSKTHTAEPEFTYYYLEVRDYLPYNMMMKNGYFRKKRGFSPYQALMKNNYFWKYYLIK